MENSRILIVDDRPEIRLLVERILGEQGLKVAQAKNGKEAINFIDNGHQFDLILLDVMMDEMDGYETLTHINSIKESIRPKVCFLTAKRERQDVVRGVELGAHDYLTKPIDRDLLVAKVHELLSDTASIISFSEMPVSLQAYIGTGKKANAEITMISEAYMEITADIPLEKGKLVEIKCQNINNIIESNKIYCRVVRVIENKPKYFVKVSFVGLTESEKGKIRSFTINKRDIA